MKTAVMAMSIYYDDESPVYGERSIHIKIDDESGGSFFVVTQNDERSKTGEIRLEVGEIEKLAQLARQMMKGYPEEI